MDRINFLEPSNLFKMRSTFVICFLLLGGTTIAQDSIVSLDALSAPQSPAANLMGFTDSEIVKPENPTDFMTNIKSASNGFSTVPNSFAVDFRVKNFIRPSHNNSFSDFIRLTDTSNKADVWNNMVQTSVISVGYKNYSALNDSIQTGQGIGLGFKMSLYRGKQMNKQAQKSYYELIRLQKEIGLAGLDKQHEWKSSETYKDLIDKAMKAGEAGDAALEQKYMDSLEAIYNKWTEKHNEALLKLDSNLADFQDLKTVAESFEFKTFGFVWDVAGGAVFDFPTNNFDYSLAGRMGLWTTLGYESQTGWSFLGMGRGLHTPNLAFTNNSNALDTANITNYDLGVRVLYEYPGKSFSLSAEGIYRGVLGNMYDPTYRFTLNLGYEVYKNMKLTFVFGRDYNGTITREGNLISALHFVMGFGGKKSLNDKFDPSDL